MAKINKAIVAVFATGSLVFTAAAILNNPLEQLAAGVAAGLVAGFIVWLTPNAPATPTVLPPGSGGGL